MANFEPAVALVLENEGGYEIDSNDPGGATNLGISLRFLKSISPLVVREAGLNPDNLEEDIQSLTPGQAKVIYQFCFWDEAPFNQIERQAVASYLFDFAVNAGIAPAVKCVQRATWAVMGKWGLLADDGVFGDKTLAAIRQSGMFLLPALKAERAAYYRAIVVNRPEDKEFLEGWLTRCYK